MSFSLVNRKRKYEFEVNLKNSLCNLGTILSTRFSNEILNLNYQYLPVTARWKGHWYFLIYNYTSMRTLMIGFFLSNATYVYPNVLSVLPSMITLKNKLILDLLCNDTIVETNMCTGHVAYIIGQLNPCKRSK